MGEALTGFLTRSVRVGDQVRLAGTTDGIQWTASIPEGREDLRAVVSRFDGHEPAQARGREVFADPLEAKEAL